MNASLLILLAHGSRDTEWNECLRRMTRELRQTTGKNVSLAFMDLAEPDLEAVLERDACQGARHQKIEILPLFLADAGHVRRDIPKIVAAAEEKYPGLRIQTLPAIGSHPLFFEALKRIIG